MLDNGQYDSNPEPGEFLFANAPLGTYTIEESQPPEGYLLDSQSHDSVSLTLSEPNKVIEAPWINQGQAKIAPTQTTCQDYTTGLADDLDEIYYGVQNDLISNVSPGVFFYFTPISAPTDSPFNVSVVQTSNFVYFDIQKKNQIWLYEQDCSLTNVSYNVDGFENGQIELTVSDAVPGRTYILVVKYSSANIVGESPPASANYSFATWIEGSKFTSDPGGITLMVR